MAWGARAPRAVVGASANHIRPPKSLVKPDPEDQSARRRLDAREARALLGRRHRSAWAKIWARPTHLVFAMMVSLCLNPVAMDDFLARNFLSMASGCV